MKKLILFTLFLILILVSCKNEDSIVNQNTLHELVPLKIGNWWAFQRINYDSTGNAVSTFIDTMKVLRDTVIQNERWFITNYYGIYRNATNGVRFWDSTNNSSYVYLYPVKEHDMFVMGSAIVEVISTNEKLKVPYGDISCVHYKATFSSLNNFHINYYLSPGIGFVSLEGPARTISGRSYLYYREQLVSYSLK
ncbi:MAG: hypothetical protein A2499_03580 [Stygiobacter sp. RIFOXYC12_FULL_38_8]|nr:MAG: hypothetical protein A2X62_11020 [Stygiobacter sp. GWC2_38_9]OGV08971.1 MAG: hypothetical protein A2299_16755 [Stygiobacter sp. RIFOXYB2_FULL_37_11]OGV11227.1 MAG: hypothetical protein A2237_18390 [Stygiobacter sp. RIFOXYA2_FULL_38_8]OGV12096.1 MAG: hypothetical protein A2440_17440 [Stygiobacter sp. RIFOXYC2_FULL_38_25]OGV23535.1 MAG: hypothetical protein A2499_03580 [Stygiobacter sp. RIFOXYC12_FULL_38_8]OGV81222.1 MAG: hypothetical protein A2X65_00015 [Stygiobacter sp. GWF2_38_21]RJQ